MSTVQFCAADPQKSCWVSASAGSGKTKVLVDRLVRLLLSGEDMRSLVGFTYTNAAALEMKERLQKRLEDLASHPDDRCAEDLRQLLQREPTRAEWLRARSLAGLFRQQQQSLRIQTLHSFCKDFLEHFSLSSEIYGPLTVLEGAASQRLLAQTQEEGLLTETSPTFLQYFQTLLAAMPLETIGTALQALLTKRQDFAGFMSHFDEEKSRTFLASKLGHGEEPPAASSKEISALANQLLRHEGLPAADLSTLQAAAQGRFFQAFLTQSQRPRKRLLSPQLQKKEPELSQVFLRQATLFVEHGQWERTENLITQSLALIHVADLLFQRYQDKKYEQHSCDFEDLILRTQQLLDTLSADETALAECRRTFPVRHIFLDEAQDTSLAQWKILMQMIHVFFTEASCTVFVVGDVKQSIYSFQGAKPWLFQTLPAVFQQMIQQRGGTFQTLYLQTSYRTTPAILRVVDRLFQAHPCGVALDEVYRPHQSARIPEGFVKSLKVEVASKSPALKNPEEATEPDEATSKVDLLAETVAEEIQSLLEKKLYLPSVGRALQPEDIFVLSKKRGNLGTVLRQKLAHRGIPAAAPDRLILSQSLLWNDLVTFVSFLAAPYDDYTLACLLKSPFLLESYFSEEELFQACYDRQGTLWDRLQTEERWRAPQTKLTLYLAEARKAITKELFFVFFARVLGDLQPAFQRLFAETEEVLHGFLDLLTNFLKTSPPSLSRFCDFLTESDANITLSSPAPTSPQGVRFSTVHSSKGLQAPLVILVDLGEPLTLQKEPWLCLEDAQHQGIEGFVLTPPATLVTSAAQRLREDALQQLLEENRRLLYVALTRAQDGLIVVGAQKSESWSGLVAEALEGRDKEGTLVFQDDPKPEKKPLEMPLPSVLGPLPSRLLKSLESAPAHEETLTGDSSSNRGDSLNERKSLELHPLEPLVRVVEPVSTSNDSALLGIDVHRFLQTLAEKDYNESTALQWFENYSSPQVIQSLREDPFFLPKMLTLPQKPEFAFMKWGRPEVTLFEDDQLFRVDYLFVDDERVVVLEVKTTSLQPTHGEDIYRSQLSHYRELLRRLYPQHNVMAYFVWARHGLFTELPEATE